MSSDNDRSDEAERLFTKVQRWFSVKPKSYREVPLRTPMPATELPPEDMQAIGIETAAGILRLTPVSQEQVRTVASRWPMGMGFGSTSDPYYLHFQIGAQEAYGLKLQPPDTDETNAKHLHFRNLNLIAAALPHYIARKHQGLMLPCAYLKEKGEGRFESGLAFFVGPDPASGLGALRGAEVQFDDSLGCGASKMVMDFIGALTQAGNQLGIELGQFIGIDLRPRLALGHLGFSFLICGDTVLAIQHPLHREHPFWEVAVRSGFAELLYAPMVPSAVPSGSYGWSERVKILSDRLRSAGPQNPGTGAS